ncbi:MAG: TetR family transcriptional regulator [Gemmatimonadota bacterium]|nr:TetR family transcriptional regulator [Gemmatimonadota bacterium]
MDDTPQPADTSAPGTVAASADGRADGQATEARIFDAALHVFARKGRDGARMQEIADEAGIHRGLLHYYFRSKDRLYREVFTYLFRQFMASIEATLEPGLPFPEMLRRFIEHYIDYLRDRQDMLRLMVNENVSGGTLIGEHLARAFATEGSPQQRMEESIRGAADRGEIRSVDPRQTILSIVSACGFFLIMKPTVRALNPEARDDFDAFVESRKRHVYELVFEGLRPREAST